LNQITDHFFPDFVSPGFPADDTLAGARPGSQHCGQWRHLWQRTSSMQAQVIYVEDDINGESRHLCAAGHRRGSGHLWPIRHVWTKTSSMDGPRGSR